MVQLEGRRNGTHLYIMLKYITTFYGSVCFSWLSLCVRDREREREREGVDQLA